MAQNDSGKWNLPGWRIEQRFANKVLIGNWSEERYAWSKSRVNSTSTHRMDFKHNSSFKPDVLTRRSAMMKNDGLPGTLIFHHHGNHYSNNMISSYDEHFNRKEREPSDRLPRLRHWDSHSLAWEPEKSDHPMKGAPTQLGLHDKLKQKWATEQKAAGLGAYHTTYGHSYVPQVKDALVTNHYSAPRVLSTRMHNGNKINKDLYLRNVSVIQTPDKVFLPASTRPQTCLPPASISA
ncbi:cilia- and flagella-associated protein 107-like [Antedon mediterranea]|uniref:cilia- and flagella-associated protein 107-like n=1 Tax=Antedon mediterranea TaxID=105859 RepID=UPI003AF5DE3D